MRIWPVFSIALIVLTLVPIIASADVWACDQTGTPKSTFYSNETVYVTSGNITTGSQSVRVYKVLNNDSWVDGKALSDFGSYITPSTNASGHLPVTLLWSSPQVGSYDIVADVDKNGVYNSSFDFLNSSSAAGLIILQAPIPTLTISAGNNTPSSHDWDLNDTGYNSMMQIVASASIESVSITSLSVTADGSGDDKEGIMVVYLILDSDSDANYDQGETVLGFSQYYFDNGVATMNIDDGLLVSKGESATLLITYSMSKYGDVGDTYRFDLVTISATGETGESATVVGLPIGSAIKTISGEAVTTTTTTSTTTTIPTDECETDSDCNGISCSNSQKAVYTCEYDSSKDVNICASTITVVECCGDADCAEGDYCLNYECVKEGGGIDIGSLLGGGLENYTTVIVSIVIVSIVVVAVFLFIKNRKRDPWKSKGDYEGEWESLKGKWRKR